MPNLTMSHEAMLEAVNAHLAAEERMNIEETLDTMWPIPYWEHCTIGVRVQGRDAVGAWYTRINPPIISHATGIKEIKITYGDGYLVAEHELEMNFPTGTKKWCPHVAYFDFDDDGKIAGERAYCDIELGKFWLDQLDEEFFKLPGVSRW